jgi:endonuclease YncB( thermonuclease family)
MLRFIIFTGSVAASIFPAMAGMPCGGDVIGTVTAASVTDGRTFVTTDGREVRLAGIETPGPRAALATLIAGKAVSLEKAGSGEDRYGRIVAYGYLGDASIQQQLVGTGQAYAAARIGSKPCAAVLFTAEKAARQGRRGLWADPELGPKSAANRDEISRLQGRFAVIEGQVLSVRDGRGVIYLNFGRQYTREFSATVLKRNAARLELAPKDLEGKRVRVRGVVEMRRGPFIELERPEQIELVE